MKMGKFLFMWMLVVGCVVFTNGKPSCKFNIDRSAPGRFKTRSHTIICTNLTSDYLVDSDLYQQFKEGDVVTLIVVNSALPTLPSTTSLPTGLRKLFINNVGLKKLSPGEFSGLSKLKSLELTDNKLTKISKGVFDNFVSLESLDLSNNLIEEIEEDSFSKLANLRHLLLSRNKLRVIHRHFTEGLHLCRFDICDNPAEEFEGLGASEVGILSAKNLLLKAVDADLREVKMSRVFLNGGQLEKIDLALFPRTSIHASSNKISSVQNWNKMDGYSLVLSRNLIAEAEIGDNVYDLDLSHNKIAHIRASQQSKNIKILDLSFNEISELDPSVFSGMFELLKLSLQNNKISVLRPNTFVNCVELVKINLSYNEIAVIEPHAFDGISSTPVIKLGHNKLTSSQKTELEEAFDHITL